MRLKFFRSLGRLKFSLSLGRGPGRGLATALMVAALALAPLSSLSQTYPTKPVHIIVAFAPGGPVDVVARLVAAKLPDIIGQPVVVENRPSTSGNLGTQVVARSTPD